MIFSLPVEANLFDKSGSPHAAINVLVTPDCAKYMVEKYNYVNQRPCSKSHMLMLAEVMRRDEFREYTSIHFAVLNGIPVLINGQHTLRAVATVKKPIWLCVHLDRVEDEAGVEYLYGKHDLGRNRSLRDVMGSIGEDLGLNVKERDGLASAVGWIHLGFRPYGGADDPLRILEAKNHELRKSLMREWSQEAKCLYQAIASAPGFNRALFFRGAVEGVALITMRHCEEKAIHFWSGAANDDGLRNGDPRKALINWLRNNPVGKSPLLQHRAAIACWNAWVKEKELTKVYPDTEASLKILGAPVDIGSGKIQSMRPSAHLVEPEFVSARQGELWDGKGKRVRGGGISQVRHVGRMGPIQ